MWLPENKNYKQTDENQLPVNSGSGIGIMEWDFYVLFYTFSFKRLFPYAHFVFYNKNHARTIHFSKWTSRFPSQKNTAHVHIEAALSKRRGFFKGWNYSLCRGCWANTFPHWSEVPLYLSACLLRPQGTAQRWVKTRARLSELLTLFSPTTLLGEKG